MKYGAILIVDDDPINLAALGQVLAGDYQLVYARSGQEALTAASRHHPALILLDIQMPGMSGYEVCAALKKNPDTDGIPVVFVTAMSDIGHEAEGFALGAVDFIAKPFSPLIVQARVRAQLSLVRATVLEKSYRDAISMLGEAAHFNDSDTGVHIWRMAAYAAALARARGWDTEDCRLIELASPMHDTGKLGIPQSILQKPGPLDAQEWEVMKTHSRIGYDILSRSDSPVFRMAADIALRHHEKWDGSGYPEGLSGIAIPESARIVAIADVFDALTMKRPYKKAWSAEQALSTMRAGSGTHFDPQLLELYFAIMPKILQIKAYWDQEEQSCG